MTHMLMINPALMCSQHLRGEHKEVHQANGSLKKKKSITGYVKNRLIEPLAIKTRHDILAKEMIKRGMNHKSPLNSLADLSYLSKTEKNAKVNTNESIWFLLNHKSPLCKCKERISTWLFKRYQRLILERAWAWSHHKNCQKDILLNFDDLTSIGYEVFIDCLKKWDWQKGSFCTLLHHMLQNKYRTTIIYNKEKNEKVDLPEIPVFSNTERYIMLKQMIQSLSSNAQYICNSALNTPLGMIQLAKEETDKVEICQKRITRHLTENENWSIYACWQGFKEIKKSLEKL